jgi:hypothetical protein
MPMNAVASMAMKFSAVGGGAERERCNSAPHGHLKPSRIGAKLVTTASMMT